jgi:hypothetical protein
MSVDHFAIVFKKLEEELTLVRDEEQPEPGTTDITADEIDVIAELVRVVADIAEPEVHFHTTS